MRVLRSGAAFRRAVIFVLALAASLVSARVASAHASLLSSAPADGAMLASSPREIRLLFSEPVVAELSHIILSSSAGKTSRLSMHGDPHEVRALIANVPLLAGDAYRVSWHIISADGHPVSGTFVFSVGSTAAAPPAVADSPSRDVAIAPALLRGLALSALLAVCGLLGFAGYSTAPTAGQIRLCRWLVVGACILLTVHLIVWLVHVSPSGSLDQDIVRAALSREVGLNELVRVILAFLALWALLLARRLRLAFAFALAAVIAGGAIGHPAAMQPMIAIPAKALHLVGVAFWLGGLLWLSSIDRTTDSILDSAATVSSVALISIGVVALTGIVQAFLFLPEWTDLYRSAYGLTLTGKTAGLLVLAGFGAYHKYRLLPRLADPAPRQKLGGSLKREIAVMIAVVMLGGVLAYVPTPEHAAAPSTLHTER